MIDFEAKFHEQERDLIKYRSSLMNLAQHGDKRVRQALATEGLMLDILVNDVSWEVRELVAYQGYGLAKLVSDPHLTVRCAAREMQ